MQKGIQGDDMMWKCTCMWCHSLTIALLCLLLHALQLNSKVLLTKTECIASASAIFAQRMWPCIRRSRPIFMPTSGHNRPHAEGDVEKTQYKSASPTLTYCH